MQGISTYVQPDHVQASLYDPGRGMDFKENP